MKSPYSRFRQPTVVEDTTVKQDGLPWKTISFILVAFSAFLLINNYVIDDTVIDDDNEYIDDGDDEQPEPDDSEKVELSGSYLIRVYETEADDSKPWMVKMLDDDAFWYDWIAESKMRLFTFDPDSNPEQSKSFIEAAKKKSIDPPFVMHAKDGKVLTVMPMTQDLTTSKIKETVLSKAK